MDQDFSQRALTLLTTIAAIPADADGDIVIPSVFRGTGADQDPKDFSLMDAVRELVHIGAAATTKSAGCAIKLNVPLRDALMPIICGRLDMIKESANEHYITVMGSVVRGLAWSILGSDPGPIASHYHLGKFLGGSFSLNEAGKYQFAAAENSDKAEGDIVLPFVIRETTANAEPAGCGRVVKLPSEKAGTRPAFAPGDRVVTKRGNVGIIIDAKVTVGGTFVSWGDQVDKTAFIGGTVPSYAVRGFPGQWCNEKTAWWTADEWAEVTLGLAHGLPEVGAMANTNAALSVVAQIAAMCCIDLDANLATTHNEYMAGDIQNGAFQHVLHRHTQMHAALHAAGFTAKHAIFGWPVRPQVATSSQSG